MAEHAILVWSDYICPFCRLGQHTAEGLRAELDAELDWLPFDLHPEYPPEGIPRTELERRYGTEFHDRLRESFAVNGLTYNPPPDVVPNTRLALRLNELARDRGLHEAFHDRLMDAYWAEATNIGDPDELRRLAAEVGLAADDVEQVIADPDAYLDRVQASTREAQSIGITGVPGFLLDRRLLVVGAQPPEVFRQAYRQLAEEEV
jgi:predicted DsbA family dithiol-disulfide isomerase